MGKGLEQKKMTNKYMKKCSNKFWRPSIQHSSYSKGHSIAHLKFCLRVDLLLSFSSQTQK